MDKQTKSDLREIIKCLKQLPHEDKLKAHGVIIGLKLAGHSQTA